jgi:phosphoribosylformylglycinamidine synthase PurS subunit
MEVRLEVNDQDIAYQQVDEMCKKLLANPVIENYAFELEKI